MELVARRRFGRILLVLTAALLFGGTAVRAQSTAQISGTVADPSGGVLPGATVTAVQTDTGFRREVVTN